MRARLRPRVVNDGGKTSVGLSAGMGKKKCAEVKTTPIDFKFNPDSAVRYS